LSSSGLARFPQDPRPVDDHVSPEHDPIGRAHHRFSEWRPQGSRASYRLHMYENNEVYAANPELVVANAGDY
jgi:hypothetical protein